MHKKALAINEKLGCQDGMADQYGNLGLLYWKSGALDRAEEMYKKALAIDQKLGRQEDMAHQYGSLGLIYQTRGELDRARGDAQEGAGDQ
jgi:tetratricopeptide (TPR) repeat protein